jgi:hypothetical protein
VTGKIGLYVACLGIMRNIIFYNLCRQEDSTNIDLKMGCRVCGLFCFSFK